MVPVQMMMRRAQPNRSLAVDGGRQGAGDAEEKRG